MPRSRTAQAEARLAEILKAQSEMQGRMGAMAELFGARQAELNQSIGQRIDGMTQRLGSSITEQTRSTHENLSKLQERLAVIDTAQNNIQSLARDVVGLQAILSNKQTRGAFGQSRMETIIKDGLPMGAFSLQPTLSNGTRPDCTVENAEWRTGSGHRRQVSARSLERDARGGGRRQRRAGSAKCTTALPPGYGGPYPRHFGQVPDCRRNPGHGVPVRALGIDLRGNPRDGSRRSCTRRSGRGL
jgi:hypothetical protein